MTRKNLARLLLVTLCAALSFGGSFECRSSTRDDDDRPRTSAQH